MNFSKKNQEHKNNNKYSVGKNVIIIICLSLLTFTSINAQDVNLADVTVVISNFESNKGKAYVALYNSEASFLSKGFEATFSKIENNTCTVTFKAVPKGEYAISMFHDENENNKFDTALFGIPKEDYGFSNNATGFMGPAKWKDAKFQINNTSITQNITL